MNKTKEEFKKEYEPQAIDAIKSRLAIEAVIKAEKIEATDEEIKEKIEEMAKNYGKDSKELQENENIKNYIKQGIENEKAMEFLVENSKEKKATKKSTKKSTSTQAKKTSTNVKPIKETPKTVEVSEKVEVKVEKSVAVENNTQVEDNYVMPGIFNDSNFDDFGDWETGIEITDKDFDFFDDKPNQSKTITDMDFGMDDMLTDPFTDNTNKQSSLNSLSQNTLTDIKIEDKDNLDVKNSIPSTPINNQDLGTPSSANLNKTLNSIQNSPDVMSISPINNIVSPQTTLLPNNDLTKELVKNSPNVVSSPLVNNVQLQTVSPLSNDVTNNSNVSTANDNINNKHLSTNDLKNNKNIGNDNSTNVVNNANNNTNVSSPMTNETPVNNDDLMIPRDWELRNSNQVYFENLIEKYHKGTWSYEPKLKSYLISFKRKKISKRDLYRFIISKRIKYREDVDIEEKTKKKNVSKEIKKEDEIKEEIIDDNPPKKIKTEDTNEIEPSNENKEKEDNNVNNNDSDLFSNSDNEITIDFGSAWKMLTIPDYNTINDIIEKRLPGKISDSYLMYNDIKVKKENDIKIKQEKIDNDNLLDKIAQKVFIDQYMGSLSSWNKSLSNSLSTITSSEENQLYDEHIIPSLASKALNQLQIIFEDLFGCDVDQKFSSMKNMYIEGPLTIKQLYDSEHSQHAKYGKYQVKKKTKKNIDYVLEKLTNPDIVVENNNEWISS